MKLINMLLPVTGIFFSLGAYSQIKQSQKLKTVAEFGNSMAIGLSVNSENRVFVSFPNYNGDGYLAVAEVNDGRLLPYPNKEWNTKGKYDNHFLRVQDLFVDADDNLWVLDSKPAASGNIFGNGNKDDTGQFKLVKIDTKTNKVEKVYSFDDLDKSRSALNDVRIDTEKGYAYFSDPGLAAVVVLNLNDGKSRVLLKNSKYTLADDIVLTFNGTEMRNKEGKHFSSNVNGIALTHDFKYFYFKPINKRQLFRIETQYLTDSTLSAAELEAKVETVANVGITHGLIADRNGYVYLTTSESYSIHYVTPDGKVHLLVEDPRIIWPDSLGIGTDGNLYFSCAQMQRLPQWNKGEDKTEYPYRIFKVQLPDSL